LIVLGETSIQYLTGEGLDDTGTSDTLSQPRAIASDVGRLGNTPVLSHRDGVYFESSKGLCLLQRSLQVEYVGAPAEGFNDLALVSAVAVPGKSQVRFGHSDGASVVFDYQAGQWATFNDIEHVSAAFWNGKHCILKGSGRVLQQLSTFLGDGDPVTLVAETPWLKLDGLQGFQRLYRVGVLGEWRSGHTLVLEAFYDYATEASETVRIDATDYAAGEPLQVYHRFSKKCQAVKFRIYDTEQSGTGESLKLTGLALEVGIKGGVVRKTRAV
jgi:hypothetical protein